MNNILAIIFAGGQHWGEEGSKALIEADAQALETLLERLRDDGVTQVSICAPASLEICTPPELSIRRLDDEGISGTLGCVFREVIHWDCSTVVIMNARMLRPPRLSELLHVHADTEAPMTVFRDPYALDFERRLTPMYVCDRALFETIPEVAFSDFKEGFLSVLKGEAGVVYLEQETGRYSTLDQYRRVLLKSIASMAGETDGMTYEDQGSARIWREEDVHVASSARMFGDIWLQQGASIEDKATLIGPVVIGAGARVGTGAVVGRSVVPKGRCVRQNQMVSDKVVCQGTNENKDTKPNDRPVKVVRSFFMTKSSQGQGKFSRGSILGAAILVAVFFWANFGHWVALYKRLSTSDEYSSGLLVPFLMGYIIWCRRESFKGIAIKPSLWGVGLLLGGQAMMMAGLYHASGSEMNLSLVVSIAGLVWLTMGTRAFTKLLTPLLFLTLMLPWPFRIQNMIAMPLQEYATKSAVFCLEVLGYDVLREGMLINIGNTTIAVAEACNGLRMITAFFVIGGLVAMLVRRPLWQKIVVFASSLPIALICNTIRLTVTSIAFTMIKGEYWEKVFHDFGGYAMMPLALALVMLELWLLEKLTNPPEKQKRVVIRRGEGTVRRGDVS